MNNPVPASNIEWWIEGTRSGDRVSPRAPPAVSLAADGRSATVTPSEPGGFTVWASCYGSGWGALDLGELGKRYASTAVTASEASDDEMALIPGGTFTMGDTFGEGSSNERPTHQVTVGTFYMGKHEVTKALWDEVYSWGTQHGYGSDNAGAGKGTDHPVHTVYWHDVLKWCNARSEKEGLSPCYSASRAVYRTGRRDDVACNWDVSGYRLPTEAEWEYAARGGLAGKRLPWGDTISHSQANYYSHTVYGYDVSPTRGYHPDYDVGGYPYTSPVGSFAANDHGLHDMSGNLWEWCWDWYDSRYYASSPGSDPRGPGSGSYRAGRGGFWGNYANGCRVADRDWYSPDSGGNYLGFRLVRAVP